LSALVYFLLCYTLADLKTKSTNKRGAMYRKHPVKTLLKNSIENSIEKDCAGILEQSMGCCTGPPGYIAGGVDASESIPGLLKSLKSPALS
jgi:hypothetical protein